MTTDFAEPVETIMKCDGFKSSFARKLSKRHTNNSSPTIIGRAKNEDVLSMVCDVLPKENNTGTLGRKIAINQATQDDFCAVGKNYTPDICPSDYNIEQNGSAKHNGSSTEKVSLQMEIEALNWQLEQTEANRQMHIALLEQVVQFLNRVQTHLDVQFEHERQDSLTTKILPDAYNKHNLPRSQSVFHVNKTSEVKTRSHKDMYAKKISRSSHHVCALNGSLDSGNVSSYSSIKDLSWNQSKLSLLEIPNMNQKLSEEISRLVKLTNTVLSTKVPVLAKAGSCEKINEPKILPQNSSKAITNGVNVNISMDSSPNQKSSSSSESLPSVCDLNGKIKPKHTTVTKKLMKNRDTNFLSSSELTCGLEEHFASITIHNDNNFSTNYTEPEPLKNNPIQSNEKKNCIGKNFIEDESGFSSMNSFQEVGLPLMNASTPTPTNARNLYNTSINEEYDKKLKFQDDWPNEAPDYKSTMKVFWV